MSELAIQAEAEADPGARRLLRLFSLEAFRPHVETPEAYDDFTYDTKFEDWDYAAGMVNTAYLGERRYSSGPASNGSVRIVWNGQGKNSDMETWSETVTYISPVLPDATYLMAGVYDAAREVETPEARALFMRLGIFYTHRYLNGNTRGGAIHECLATRGYDGSEADRLHYSLLALGRRGIKAAGVDIDPFRLTHAYAGTVIDQAVQDAGYTDTDRLPDRMAPFLLEKAVELRPLEYHVYAAFFARVLAERYSGLASATSFALGRGDLDAYLIERDDGGYDFDAERLLCTLSTEEAGRLTSRHQERKVDLVRELTGSFLGMPSVLGDWRTVAGLVRPQQTAAGQLPGAVDAA